MWHETPLTRALGIRYPLIQAPMAGGATTPALVAAVCESGALGSFAAAFLTPAQIDNGVREIRALTRRPFAINLFAPEPPIEAGDLTQITQILDRYRAELGLPQSPPAPAAALNFAEQFAAVVAANPAVVSFTFGLLPSEAMRELKAAGIYIIGTATTVAEARALEAAGVHMIAAQGYEAGAHRGTFAAPVEQSLVGILALVPQIVDQVQIPVIASGGIMDARGLVAALSLGAAGAQMGTAFLTCAESGASDAYKQAILASNDQSTALTRAFTGRHARGLRNRFIDELRDYDDIIPPYAIQRPLARDIVQAAAKQGRVDLMPIWAGQGSALARSLTAAELIAEIVAEAHKVLNPRRRSEDLAP